MSGKGSYVCKNNSKNSGFQFTDPRSNTFIINVFSLGLSSNQETQLNMGSRDSNQPTPVLHKGPFMGAMLSPNMMPTQQLYNTVPSQASVTPAWLPELIADVKQITLSLTKLETMEKTVSMINMKVTDLESKVNTTEPTITEVEKSCSFISKENDDRKKELDRAKGEVIKVET